MGRRILGLRRLAAVASLMVTSVLTGFSLPVILAGQAEGVVSPEATLPRAAPREPLAGRVSGSAFAVAPGMLVTNMHVVLRCRMNGAPLQVAGWPGTFQVVREESSSDLALIAGPYHGTTLPLSAGGQLARGASVLVLGYPAASESGMPFGTLRSQIGRVTRAALTVHRPDGDRALSLFMTDRQGRDVEPSWEQGLSFFGQENAERLRWLVEIDVATLAGGSGGPLIDGSGNVVGVVFAGGGDRGVTSAVPLGDLKEFLSRAGVVPAFRAPGPPGSSRVDWHAVERAASRAVVRPFC